MNVDVEQLLSETEMDPPCPPDELADFIEIVGPVPHQDYLDFMAKHNGCGGPIGREGYIVLWPLDEVVSTSEQPFAAEGAPGLLLFGGDGANEVFAFDRYDPKWPIVNVPFICMSREDIRFVAATFTELIQRLAADEPLL